MIFKREIDRASARNARGGESFNRGRGKLGMRRDDDGREDFEGEGGEKEVEGSERSFRTRGEDVYWM